MQVPSSEAAATAVSTGGVTGAMLAALHCDIAVLPPESSAYDALQRLVCEDNEAVDPQQRIHIRRV